MYELFNTKPQKQLKIYNTNDKLYIKPPISLLEDNKPQKNNVFIDYSDKIKEFYKIFKIDLNITKYIDSLSVSRFYATIEGKTKINSIERLTNELAIYLGAKNVNVLIDSINNNIIFEIPKKTRQNLGFKDIIIQDSDKKEGLQVALGKDLNNNIFEIDLCKMPHLLVSGTTGSGKSVLLNTIILSLLYNYSPQELNLLLIDPKKVELSNYENIPQLRAEIATDTETARQTLDFAIKEMLSRYEILKQNKARNIESYNKQNANKLPYLVIVIDELADLMLSEVKTKLGLDLTGTQRIDEKICRIAQMGRACGVHLIVSTQRPSTDVITGLIKANIPSRIALSVSNIYDSKVILDRKGAEKLTGNGDMYYKQIGADELIRIQGAFIQDAEIEKIVNYIRGGIEDEQC